MTEKNLINKLNNLKNVNPDAAWLKSSRDLFLAQITNAGSGKLSFWQMFIINGKSFLQAASKPAFALGTFMVVLVASSIFGHKLFSEAKPNDSLYIARVISEKAKLSTVIDTNERNRMAVKFATNHAKDITVVLSNPEFNTEENQDQVARLNENFNREIDTVITRMERMTPKSPENVGVELSGQAEIAASSTADVATSSDEEVVSIATEEELIAEAGIQVSTQAEVETVVTPEVEEIKSMPAQEARELLKNKEYDKVIEKLERIKEASDALK